MIKIIVLLISSLLLLTACATHFDYNDINLDDNESNVNVTTFPSITSEDFNITMDELTSLNDRDDYFETFVDERGVEFLFDVRTDKLARVFIPSDLLSWGFVENSVYSVEEMQHMAIDIASNFVNDITIYDIRHFSVEHMGTHSFRFERIIQGFNTRETGRVSIRNGGVIDAASFFSPGLFDDVYVPPLNKYVLDLQFEIAMREYYSNIEIDSFIIINRTLDYVDGQLFILYGFVYRTIFCYEDEYSEALGLNIPILR